MKGRIPYDPVVWKNRFRRIYRHDRYSAFGYSARSEWENFAGQARFGGCDSINLRSYKLFAQRSQSAYRQLAKLCTIENLSNQLSNACKSGELSPAEATQLLLAGEGIPEVVLQYESLASLVDRLGVPPRDIVDSWCQQLCDIARQHEHETGESLPAIDLNQWSITRQGQFAWNGRLRTANHGGKQTYTIIARSNRPVPHYFDSRLLRSTVFPRSHQLRLGDRRKIGRQVRLEIKIRTGIRTRTTSGRIVHGLGHIPGRFCSPRQFLAASGREVGFCIRSSQPVMETAANNDTPATFSTDLGPRASRCRGRNAEHRADWPRCRCSRLARWPDTRNTRVDDRSRVVGFGRRDRDFRSIVSRCADATAASFVPNAIDSADSAVPIPAGTPRRFECEVAQTRLARLTRPMV